MLTLELAAVSRLLPELGLAEVGTLAFFYYDGRHLMSAAAVSALREALSELPWNGWDQHLVGGHATPQQGPVEYEVEQLRCALADEPFDSGSPQVVAALPRWRSLLQVGSDNAGMMWGDVGQLHWLIRDDALPEEAAFTCQCG